MTKPSYDPRTVGIAVIVSSPQWYSGALKSIRDTDKVRGDASLELLQKAAKTGYQVVVAERGSSNEFVKTLKAIKGLHIISRVKPGRSAGKRQVVEYISQKRDIQVIVLTEPEKSSFIDSLDAVVSPVFAGKADFVLPRRQDDLFQSSYPAYMYESEIEANRIYNKALRDNGIIKKGMPDFDWYFGPRVFRNDKKIIKMFMKIYTFENASIVAPLFNPDEYSNTQYFPFVTALRERYKVMDVAVPFVYPKTQKENEETGARDIFMAKRRHQQVSLLIDLMHYLSSLRISNKNS